jgi:hypothetical protein
MPIPKMTLPYSMNGCSLKLSGAYKVLTIVRTGVNILVRKLSPLIVAYKMGWG